MYFNLEFTSLVFLIKINKFKKNNIELFFVSDGKYLHSIMLD